MCANENKNIQGMMLIELMISLFISMAIISCLIEIYINLHRSYQLQSALMQIQNTAKQAIFLLNSDIKKAGYIGCPRLTKEFKIASCLPYSLTTQNMIFGNHTEITVMHVAHRNDELVSMPNPHTLIARGNLSMKPGEIVLISDCKNAELFRVDKIRHLHGLTTILTREQLQKTFTAFAELAKLEINTFTIKNTGRFYENGSKIYALYVTDVSGKQYELVPGINHIYIRYDVWGEAIIGVAIELEITAPPLTKIWHSYIAMRA